VPRLADVPWFLALGVCGVGVPQATIFIGNHLAGAAYAGIFSEPITLLYFVLG
jgi:hypothetical protein